MINLNFQITKFQQKNNIVVFFLKSKNISSNNYLTFTEAVNKKLVDVTKENCFSQLFYQCFSS